MSLRVLPAALFEDQNLLCLGCLFDSCEYAGLLYSRSANTSVILSAYHQDILKFELSANFMLKHFTHHSVILSHLVLQTLHSNDCKYLLRISGKGYSFIRVVHI